MNTKIQNQATGILLEILGILGIENIVKKIEAETDTKEQTGYLMINYIFKNNRKIMPQLEELVDLFIDEYVSVLKGFRMLTDDKEVVSFFTQSLSDLTKLV